MRRFVALAALLVVVAGLAPVASVSQVQAHDAPILLRAATFRPGLGEEPDLPPSLTAAEPAAGQYGYYLVQFAGPIQPAWKKALAATGAEPVAYVPEFAFKLRMTPAVAARVRRLPGVTWLGPFHPAYKLSPDLVRDGTRLYAVRIERGADARQAAAALARSGAQIVAGEGDVLWLAAGADQVEAIAQVLDVAWIENLALPETHNEYGAGVILGANVANASGYDGSTQTVAVADTGLGGGTASTAHSDIPAGRITAIYNRQGVDVPLCYTVLGDGAQDVASGHGTHTALSVLGNGGAGGEGRGTAPAANLVFQAIEDYADMIGICALVLPDGYYLLGLPTDIRDLFQQAYTAGARIHSNSWGTALTGVYTTQSANTDDFVWNHPEMTITFSAGNAGVDADADGYVDEGSTNSPGTAKNLITVGASENDRQGNWDCDTALNYTDCAAQGGQNDLFTYGAGWPDNFPADPLAGDPSAGNAEQLAAFSSRGPTSDGRIKPDLVAPGTWVLSGYSDLYQEGYDPSPNPQDSAWQYDGWGFPLSAQYKYMGGTSMSNPLTAGAAAVVRDFYQKAHGHGASAALVKATLINSAQDLLDENNDGVNDNDHPIPNNHEGWGRVDLAAATDGSHQFVDEGTGLGTGGSATYPFNIGTAGQPFKVSLVWSDYPSAEAALKNLVNDLDLVVTAPGGAVYWGNVFSGGWSQTGDSADRTNNLENVYLQSAAAGTWSVQVSGYNVPNGPQPFALVVDGAFGQVDNPPNVNITDPAEGATVSGQVTITAVATDDNGVTQVEFFVDGGSIGVDETAPYSVAWDSTTVNDGGHVISATATDTIDQTGSDSNNVTVDNVLDPTVHVGDLDGSSAEAPRGRWDATVTITIHDSSEAAVADALVEGNWSNGATGGALCTTNASGQCSVSKANLKSNVPSVAFSVSNVTSSAGAYVPGDNHDPEGDSNGTTITVLQPSSNTPPTANITQPADGTTFASGATINFAGTANDAEDGDITANLVWTSNIDGQIGSGGSFSAVLSDGVHTITASATDSGGATGSDSIDITVGTVVTVVMHIGDLDGSSASAARNRWDATVVITVHDESHGPVENATVDGSWSAGATGGGSCVTNASGQCSVTKTNIKGNVGSVTFTVNDVTRGSDTYSGVNHDPDGDSDGTTITVLQP